MWVTIQQKLSRVAVAIPTGDFEHRGSQPAAAILLSPTVRLL
jgi:hypothetical protein